MIPSRSRLRIPPAVEHRGFRVPLPERALLARGTTPYGDFWCVLWVLGCCLIFWTGLISPSLFYFGHCTTEFPP